MNINCKLISGEADVLFDAQRYTYPLDSPLLEAMFRYIPWIRNEGNKGDTKKISCYIGEFTGTTGAAAYASDFLQSNYAVGIYQGRSGADLPTLIADGWTSLDSPPYPVAPFLSKSSPTNIYINAESRKALIFVKKASLKWIYEFCSSLFRILTWFYPEGYNLTDDEKALYQSIHNRDADKANEIFDKAIGDFEFRSFVIKKTLTKWGNAVRNNSITKLEQQRDRKNSEINSYEEILGNLYADIADIITNLAALRSHSASDEGNELTSFFDSHKSISVERISQSGSNEILEYSILETLEYYDEDQFERVVKNKGSYFWNELCYNDVRKILIGIFLKHYGVIRVDCVFYLTGLSALNVKRYARKESGGKPSLGHPHLVNYGCLGGNGNYITSYMKEGRWDMAIEQSISAAKNINFGDTTVVNRMMSDIYHSMDVKYIIADDGTEMSPREFLKYIDAKEERKE